MSERVNFDIFEVYPPPSFLKLQSETGQELSPEEIRCLAEIKRVDFNVDADGTRKKMSTEINCFECSVTEKFRNKGDSTDVNERSRDIEESILQTCPRLVDQGYTPGQIPKEILPEITF